MKKLIGLATMTLGLIWTIPCTGENKVQEVDLGSRLGIKMARIK